MTLASNNSLEPRRPEMAIAEASALAAAPPPPGVTLRELALMI